MPAPGAKAPPSAPTPAPSPAPTPAPTPTPSASSSKQSEAAALTAATAAVANKGPELPKKQAATDARAASAGFGLDLNAAPPASLDPSRPARVVETPLGELERLAVDGGSLTATGDGQLVMPVNEVGYVRTDLLTSLSGAFEIEVVNRRYRGKRTDSLFGGIDASVVAIMGQGFCVLDLGELVATALTLTSEEVYLVESAVVGFSSGLVWENGRLPSESDKDLDIVHLRGSGRVVLGAKQRVSTLPVKADAPVVVHAHRLLGWTGQLVPYRAPLPGLPETARRVPVVRFEGTGTVLSL